ncbi:helix-turn-helix transcriptional regulator [Micromonospora sonneratiae]|uniref:Helix-turn-helix domain-containing protein n=1 Tax=Micromonospora sonneratiae TaxID=1184706 RepID=A0ABW3YMM0_9ACTN
MNPTIDPGMTPGQRIKLYRQRAGLTQEIAAQLKGCTVSAWRKWESGERSVNSLGDWIEIARILRVRDLYRLTGLPVGQLPDEPAEHEGVAPIRAAMHAYSPAATDAALDLEALRQTINYAWTSWSGSGQRYSRTAPMLPELIHAVRTATGTLAGEALRDAHRAAADPYLLVRSFGKRVGAGDVAILAADRALTAAQAADDPLYRGAAAWNMAQVLSNRGHAEESAALCRDAITDLNRIDDQDPERIAVVGGLHQLSAIQHARLRNERYAEDALSMAEHAAAITGETTYHHMFVGPANVGIHRAAVTLELSRPAEALRIGERVDVTGSPSVERRHSHYLNLARAYAVQRDDLAAVHMLVRADREAPEESSLNMQMRAVVRELLTRETPTTRPELRPLAERIDVA